jgi:hypothetical protein
LIRHAGIIISKRRRNDITQSGEAYFLPLGLARIAASPLLTAFLPLAHRHVVVTHEIPSDSRRRIKIPNACIGVGIKFMTPYDLFNGDPAPG